MLLLTDAFCMTVCFAASVMFYHAVGGEYDPKFYLQMWPIVPAFLAVNVLFRLYHGRLLNPGMPFSPVEEMRRLVGSAIIVHLGVIAVLALTRQTMHGYSRIVIILSGVLTIVLAQSMRNGMRMILKRLDIGQIPVILVGEARELQYLKKAVDDSAFMGLRLLKSFAEASSDEIVRSARKNGVKVLLVCEDARLFRCRLEVLSEWFTHIVYFPGRAIFPVSGSRTIVLDGLGGVEMINQRHMSYLRIEKFIVDKGLAAIAFVLLLPVLFVLALMVKLSSSGPIFFRHERLGVYGKPIRIWKFRTMYWDAEDRLKNILSNDVRAAAEWNAYHKLRKDPRVTRVGRFLRKTSLDELPQIFNVLAGSMALVGPRPIVRDEVEKYGAAYRIFSAALPGMTGLWQVSGRSETDYAHRVALDTYYVLNWSPWLDFWILMRTVDAVLFMRGAR